jgi:hypothetical protein
LAVAGLPAAAAQQPRGPGYGPWAFLLCNYPDRVFTSADVVRDLLTRPDGLWDYFAAVSYGHFQDSGSVVVDSVTLPMTVQGYDTLGAVPGLIRLHEDCLAAADPRVHYPDFYGIVFRLNGTRPGGLGSVGGGRIWALDGTPERRYGMATLAGVQADRRSVHAHEMGHGLGLLHAGVRHADGTHIEYSAWDLMGSLDGQLGAAYMDWLGWLPAGRRLALPRNSAYQLAVQMVRLAAPPPDGLLMLEFPLDDGSGHSYTIEARRKVGADRDLMEEGLLVRRSQPIGIGSLASHILPVVRDGLDTMPPGREGHQPGDMFGDSVQGFYVSVDSLTADGYGVTVMRGWPVIVTVDGPGGITGLPGVARCEATCTAVVAQRGDTVHLVAEPDLGEPFAGWTGDCEGTGGCTLAVQAARRVSAVFAPPLVVLTAGLPPARAGAAYEAQLAATTGSDVRWRVDTATTPVPQGLALDSITGMLEGVPLRTGQHGLSVVATWKGLAADATLTLTVLRPDIDEGVLLDGLLGLSPLPADVVRLLDASGNENGVLDLGDFRAWVRAEGLEDEASAWRLTARPPIEIDRR